MTFEYLDRKFELMEAVDNLTSDYCEYSDMFILMELIVEDVNDKGQEIYKYKFINYFYGAMSYDKDEAIKIAKSFIDEDSMQQFAEIAIAAWNRVTDAKKEDYFYDDGSIGFIEKLAKLMGFEPTDQLIGYVVEKLTGLDLSDQDEA